MLEKIISLADISLIDFLGVSNANLQALMNAFPQTKIIARGEQLTIRGSDDQISLVEAIVNQCIAHLESHSSLSVKYMTLFIDGVLNPTGEEKVTPWVDDKDVLLFGNKGIVIKVKTPNQRKLVESTSKKDIVFAIGPAGTGKTYTLNSLLKYAVKAGELSPAQIRLVAPTGRAARRIADGLAELRKQPAFAELVEPQTIHSLLYEPEAFDGMQLLVVDESSMVDLMLFNDVIDKLPAGCSLVLVGDPNQLPSVEVGSVLADLCEAPALAANKVQLVRQVRSKDAPEIMRFADSVLGGQGREAVSLIPPTPEAVLELILPAYGALRDKAREGDVTGAMALVDEVRVLCSHVRGPLGAETLARLIADKLDIRVSPPGSGSLIMVTKNDRRGTGLSNGDVGVMVGGLVYFRGHAAGFDINRLPEYASAFATTIHKAQGSEYGHAVVVLGSSQREGFLNRQLIYTGITRARKQVTLVADRTDFLAACVREVPRASGLKQRLI